MPELDAVNTQILMRLRDDSEGSISRNIILSAFKAAGGRVGNVNGRLCLGFQSRTVPIAGGDIDLASRHSTFRNVLRELATIALENNKAS